MVSRLSRSWRTATLAAVAVTALALSGCSTEKAAVEQAEVNTVSQELADYITAGIENAMRLGGANSAVVGVWQADKAYVRGFGSDAKGNPVTADTKFIAAQASQPMMCALLLETAKQEGLPLNRAISKDVTRMAGIKDITYEQLCNQKSGLQDYKTGLSDIYVNNPNRFWSEQELIADSLALGKFPWAGKDVYLSDTNAVLLNRVLRIRALGDTAEMLREQIFAPSQMSQSSYADNFDSAKLPGSALPPYSYKAVNGAADCATENQKLPAVSSTMLRGAGSVLTTVTDLKKFYTKYLAGGFGDKKYVDLPTQTNPAKNPARDENGNPTEEPDTSGPQIGFGGIEKMGPLYGRAGQITGTLTAAYRDPASDLTVVVALNNSGAGAAFAQTLALQLAAYAGEKLPWSAEELGAKLAQQAICQEPAEQPAGG